MLEEQEKINHYEFKEIKVKAGSPPFPPLPHFLTLDQRFFPSFPHQSLLFPSFPHWSLLFPSFLALFPIHPLLSIGSFAIRHPSSFSWVLDFQTASGSRIISSLTFFRHLMIWELGSFSLSGFFVFYWNHGMRRNLLNQHAWFSFSLQWVSVFVV